MYLGSLRYWLYSLVMPHEVVVMVQADADTLCWSRESELGATKRVRRFVRGKTAIGQRKKGGLNNMNWKLREDLRLGGRKKHFIL